MTISEIICIVLGIVCFFLIVMLCSINFKFKKTLKGLSDREADNVEVKNGVRYTLDKTITDENGDANISLSKSDVVLKSGQTEVVGKKNAVKPGKYTLLASSSNDKTFNVRIGGLVKEYSHGEEIVLSENEEITSVNTTIILR